MGAKQRTRERILEQASRVLRERALQGIGVGEIMQRAGLTHGGFYARFADRDALVAHAADRMFQEMADRLERHLAGPEPRAGLHGLIDAYLSDAALTAPEVHCPLPALSGDAARMGGAVQARFAQGVETMRRSVGRGCAALGLDDPEAVADSMIDEMVGAMMLARLDGDHDRARGRLGRTAARLKRRFAG